MVMDVKDVKGRVKAIKAMAADYEAAHGAEDSLYEDILRTISDGECESIIDAEALCYEALKTKKLDFPRYTA